MIIRYDSEYYQYTAIQQRKMALVPEGLDKREGSVIFIATAPGSQGDAESYSELKLRYDEGFADTCSREYLIRRCAEQGIAPYPAKYAIITATFVGATPVVGDRFSTSDNTINYAVSSIVSDTYYLTCETAGNIGNIYSGSLIPIVDIPNFESGTITGVSTLGEDEESTENLRARYRGLFNFDRPFAGNVAGFVELTDSISGVGATKVIRAWNGGGTCKLIILDSDLAVPSSTLVNTVQGLIDPTVADPLDVGGQGLAPIFCKTTVVGATSTVINIVASITYLSGYTWEICKPAIFDVVNNYLADLRADWENESQTVVSINRVLVAILGVIGVNDVTAITLNGTTANVTIDVDKIPIGGTINGESN